MKKTLKTIAFLAVLSVAATGCQKEELISPTAFEETIGTTLTVVYTVDGVSSTTTFDNEAAWLEFLDYLVALAEEGHSVSFRDSHSNQTASSLSKDVVTYTTRSRDDAKTWADGMTKQGYTVDIDYDSTTGIYTCIATKL